MKIKIEDLDNIAEEPIQLFYSGIKSPETKEKYTRILKKILCDNLEDVLHGSFEERAAELVKKSKTNPEFSLSILLAISRKLRARTELPKEDKNYLNPSSVENFFKPIKKLFDMNGVPVVWKRVYATYPEQDNNMHGRSYTRGEIATCLTYSKGAIDRAIILVASSSGVREGGLRLRWDDFRPIYNLDGNLVLDVTESEAARAQIACAVITVYKGTPEEYPAFITPEAYKALQDYRSTWTREIGREPKPSEPIFKQEGDLPIMLKPTAIKRRIERILKDASIRTPLPKGKRRHDIPVMNGFRRFFNKINKETLSKDSPLAALIKKEYQMGHTGLIKLDRSYFQSHMMELAQEYLNAVPNLTISDEERTKAQNRILRTQLSEKQQLEAKVTNLESKVDALTNARRRDKLKQKMSKEEVDKLNKKSIAKHLGNK